jgi:hypothetical protein
LDDPRLNLWEPLFRHALDIVDAAERSGQRLGEWSFGGGTVLMRRYRHRVSKDVDLFVPDPQWLGYLTPRLNPIAEEKTGEYVEQAGFLKLYFPQGELDFIVATPLTPSPWQPETIMGHSVLVETPAEIVAKKLKFRGAELKARDLLDVATVIEREPEALPILAPLLGERRSAVLHRLVDREAALREDFAQLDLLGKAPSYDQCVARVRALFRASGKRPAKGKSARR